ncbi:malate dehydrogenase (quinone) [Chryseolinea sp. T2]
MDGLLANASTNEQSEHTDIVLIGAGVMSATLGLLLKELDPAFTIQIFERLDGAAMESSDAWNNAGTGHSAFCELNYTPQRPDGTIDITKAVKIASSFEVSKQFWAHLVEQGILGTPSSFINQVPHVSFVWGQDNVQFLRARHRAMIECPLFESMQYSTDRNRLDRWMPVVMDGRDSALPLAATCMDIGTDVNFGSLTSNMIGTLSSRQGVHAHYNHEVKKLRRDQAGMWNIKVKDLQTGDKRRITARFVFIGAGGGSLRLLEKSRIPEGRGYGGFPVGGQWLVCTDDAVVSRHDKKVYGMAPVGSPPMSVPHLDTRVIGGQKALLFGPFAGFSTKFLKEGSYLDLFKSIRVDNILPMIAAGMDNIPLTRYLIDQLRLSPDERIQALRQYVPLAKREDWKLEVAGQRVQVIKRGEKEIGVLEFGTEVIASADGSLAALLGASPGASTAASIMLDVIQRCFPSRMNEWRKKLPSIIPSYGQDISRDRKLLTEIRRSTNKTLELHPKEKIEN